jgi:hypothetical protein
MKTAYHRTARILTILLLAGCLPAAAAAFTPGEFIVSPQRIDVGTVRLLSGAASDPFSFTIAVVGGPVPDEPAEGVEGESPTFFAASDASWITVTPDQGESPGSITATVQISETMGSGRWEGTITIVSGLTAPGQPVTMASIPVTVTVDRAIGDLLTVSPAHLDLMITEINAGTQTFPVSITNIDPDKPVFDWSAQTDAAWLTLSRYSGTGNATIALTVNPVLLPLRLDLNQDGVLDGDVGTVTIYSNLIPEPMTLTVQARIGPSYDLSVHPGQLFWSVEKGTGSDTLSLDPQYLQVFAGQTGWTVSCDVHFLTVLAIDLITTDITDETGARIDTQVSTDRYGRVEVTPIDELVRNMDYGYHSGTITISDRYSQFFRQIPVTLHIRQPGESVGFPVPAPEIYQISPYYSMIETAAAGLLDLQLPVPDGLAYYPTETMCRDAGGVWLDPDNVPGNLNESCSLNQQVYVLMAFPEMMPGQVYAWNRFGEFHLAFNSGIKVTGADAHTYADGPVPVIPVGPVQMLGYHGTMIISTRIGPDLNSAAETQRVQVNLRTPEGRWHVTETYNGQSYTYDAGNLLELSPTPGLAGYYSGTWGEIPVNLLPGDGLTWLYQLEFSQNGIHYTYQIQSLSAGKMAGKWRFSWYGGASVWETFHATRQLMLP